MAVVRCELTITVCKLLVDNTGKIDKKYLLQFLSSERSAHWYQRLHLPEADMHWPESHLNCQRLHVLLSKKTMDNTLSTSYTKRDHNACW